MTVVDILYRESFHCPKNFHVIHLNGPIAREPWKLLICVVPLQFPFCSMSCNWNHTICRPFRLSSSTWQYTFKMHPCFYVPKTHSFFFFFDQRLGSHYIGMTQFVYTFRFGAIMNTATIHICMQVFVCT